MCFKSLDKRNFLFKEYLCLQNLYHRLNIELQYILTLKVKEKSVIRLSQRHTWLDFSDQTKQELVESILVFFFSPLWKVVRNHFFKKAGIADFSDCFEQLALEVNATGQHIVYWSIHEEIILKKYLPANIFKMIQPRLHNLLPVARRYANRKKNIWKRTVSI